MVVIFNALSAWVVAKRAKCLLKTPYAALPDLGHIMLPQLPHYSPDIFLVAVLCLIVAVGKDSESTHNVVWATIWAGVIRGFTTHLTLMPSPLPQTAWFGTHDLMFSGHTLCFAQRRHFWGNRLS